MTTTLPDRLLAEANLAVVPPRTAEILREAAAALSVPESLEAVTQLEWSATLCDGKNVDYATAEKACAALGEGWRLPTVEELFALADRTRSEPAIDTEVFPDTESDWYWSSTITARSSVRAWCVSFSDGNAFNYRRDDNVCCVRAVRSVPSGQHAAAPSAKEVADG